MKTVPLRGPKAQGRVAFVDDEDYDLVSKHRWHVDEHRRDGHDSGPYAIANVVHDGRRTTTFMHNLIMGQRGVDHRNHNGLDNQRHNLRPATPAQNLANQRPQAGCTSRYKGVYWHSLRLKWHARITINGRSVNLGLYVREEDAARAYDAAALLHFGEFAHVNLPGEQPRLNSVKFRQTTESQIAEIRQLWATGRYTQGDIARRMGCSQSVVSRIVNNLYKRTPEVVVGGGS
jgi:MarR family